MTPQQQLEKAIILATKKHAGQTDRSGLPYILHPIRVMQHVETLEEKTVAILHDVIEDCEVTAIDLIEMGFSEEIVVAVQSVTRLDGESRVAAAARSSQNRIGCAVKLADLLDNMNLTRLPHLSSKDTLRHAEYCNVKNILEAAKLEKWNNFDQIPVEIYSDFSSDAD